MRTQPSNTNTTREDPDQVVARAKAEHKPVAVWCLFSGGNDSTVLAHRCREHYDGLAFIDTGTAVPGVAEFVADYAQWIDKPLRVMHAGDAFRKLVLGGHVRKNGTVEEGIGFPGPAMHSRSYFALKERQIRALLRESKVGHSRRARVLFLSGIRRAESQRRSRREPIDRLKGTAAVFANPLIDWTGEDMRRYRSEHELPESDAAALMHRSGECNCGAFASAAEERAILKLLYPEFFASIEALEAEAEGAGLQWCRWGGYDRDGNRATDTARQSVGLLCESCDSRQHTPAQSRPGCQRGCQAALAPVACSESKRCKSRRRAAPPSSSLPIAIEQRPAACGGRRRRQS
jgi:3'-phosphoadenosine 5'-phosphosulfate sulfotransferase (PAPS reductase)/FAD synthetase